MLRLSSFLLAALSLATPATAATGVSGTITTTTWTKANSPYRVTGQITVPTGNILTIQAGVDVLFDVDAQIRVEGAIHAMGTASDSVRFLKGAATEWGGLALREADTSSLSYARVGYSTLSGLTVWWSKATLTNCRITGNSGYYGAGLDALSSTVTLTNCTISGNSVSISDGGGLNADNSTVTLTDCAITGNSASSYGGGLSAGNSTVTVMNCTIAGNSASSGGGGLYASHSTVTLTNCTVSDNSATISGGGLNVTSTSTATLTNCTVSRNSASSSGGGLYVSSATATVRNSILWGDSPQEIYSLTSTITATDSDIQQTTGTYLGEGNMNADPLFVNPSAGDYHLQAGSPARGMGAFPWPVAVTEQRPTPRLDLWQNAPNPFNPSTTIRFTVPQSGPVNVAIYDVNGRLIRTLVDGPLLAGQHEVVWDGRDQMGRAAASGVYLYRLTSGEGTVTRKMVLVR